MGDQVARAVVAEYDATVVDNAFHWRLLFEAEKVAQLTCVEDSTCPGRDDSSLGTMVPGCMNTLLQMAGYCDKKFGAMEWGDHCDLVELVTVSLVRLKSSRSCTTSAKSHRSISKILMSQVNQPGETRCRRSTPVAAGAKAARAIYHSHTQVAERRDDYRKATQRVPGFALARSTGDPAYRFGEEQLNCLTEWRDNVGGSTKGFRELRCLRNRKRFYETVSGRFEVFESGLFGGIHLRKCCNGESNFEAEINNC